MSERPTFSVVVAAYESADRIALTLHSVLNQSRSDLELLVVDDGSRDRTAEVVAEIGEHDPRVRLIRQSNAGTARARNRGLREARGAYASFLDDDDLWLPTYLERIGEAFSAHPTAGIAYADAWVMDAPTGRVGVRSALERYAAPLRRLPRRIEGSEALRALLRANFLTTCATTVSRRALDLAGPLDPSIKGADDWDLWLRIAGEGFGAARVDERLTVLRKRADSVGADVEMMAVNSARTLEAAIGRDLPQRAEWIARRHLRVIGWELRSMRSGRGTHLARLARRLGRKRLPTPWSAGKDDWRASPPELQLDPRPSSLTESP